MYSASPILAETSPPAESGEQKPGESRFTPPEPPGRSSEGTPGDLIEQQYCTIGETIMISEAACLQVGIPWLPPTKHRRLLFKRFEAPLGDFIRYSLVGVSTKNLEAYCDDLENSVLPEAINPRADLQIEPLGLIERYSSCVLLSGGIFAICCLSALWLGVSLPAAATMALLTGVVGGAGAAMTCQECLRRNSFFRILYKELLRRRGIDDPNGGGIRLVSLESN